MTVKLDEEDLAFLSQVKQLREAAASLPISPRLSALLALVGEKDGTYQREGLEYSVDNEGFDVSVSWGDDGQQPSQFLYFQDDGILFVSKGDEDEAQERLSLESAIKRPWDLVDFSELLGQ